MADEEHLAILRQGVEVWNAWRDLNCEENPYLTPDLSEVDLSGVNLSNMNFDSAELRSANLRGTKLCEASLCNARLIGADLREADLHEADMYQVDLRGANLGRANLRGAMLKDALLENAQMQGANLQDANLWAAYLRSTDLSTADLTNATTSWTSFNDLDLSDVQGLETVFHNAPSMIDVDTLIKSKGKIPKVFLLNCGVPESFIEYLPSLLGSMEPIQFYSCFISYSTKDEAFARRLHSEMRNNNLRVWFANEDLKGGHKLHEQIDEAIRVYDKFIIVLSPESLRSKWVMNEVRRTRKAELANNQRKFFPIALLPYKELEDWECIDPDTRTDLAAEIREYFIPDFRGWKNHDKFEKAFAQLLEGLKAVDAPPAPRIEPKPKDIPQNPQTIIARKKRRLEKLEEQAAIYGISTPPEIANEIEDLRREIRELGG